MSNRIMIEAFALVLFGTLLTESSPPSCAPMADKCSCKMDNGDVISLQDINNPHGNPRFSTLGQYQQWTFQYNPCTPFTVSSTVGDGCTNVLICQSQTTVTSPPSTEAYPLAIPSSFHTAVVNGKVQFKYSGDQFETRNLIINLECDKSGGPPSMTTPQENPMNTYTFTLKSKSACPNASHHHNHHHHHHHHHHHRHHHHRHHHDLTLIIVLILCMIILVLVVTYFLGVWSFVKCSQSKSRVIHKFPVDQ